MEGRARCFVLVALLDEAGNVAARTGEHDEFREFKLKALNILLAVKNFADEDVVPDFVPKVDGLIVELKDEGIPPRSLASLMQHHEFIGAFSRAEDSLTNSWKSHPTSSRRYSWGSRSTIDCW